MKYQKLMKKIMQQLDEYKGFVDNLFSFNMAEKEKSLL
jgi:hypothetical protein